jgi:hypothetical protein
VPSGGFAPSGTDQGGSPRLPAGEDAEELTRLAKRALGLERREPSPARDES